jgi:uridine monophosphate synthetase
LPCIIVRKKEKEDGAKGRVVGAEVTKGDKIVFFDDVVSEGLSKHLIVVVDREQGGREKLEQKGFTVNSLAKISEIVKILATSKRITNNQADKVLQYIN